jgi:hypothetical protein
MVMMVTMMFPWFAWVNVLMMTARIRGKRLGNMSIGGSPLIWLWKEILKLEPAGWWRFLVAVDG